MDFVERIFHVSPDGGNRTFELVFLMFLVAVVVVRVWRKRRRRPWDPTDRM